MLFEKGNKTGGRPKGSSNRVSRKFVAAVIREWEAHGDEALKIMRIEEPTRFVLLCERLSAGTVWATMTGADNAPGDNH